MSDDDDFLIRRIGSMGIWQGTICLFIATIKLPTALNLANIIFLAPKIQSFCVDESGKPLPDIDKCSDDCPKIEYNRTIFEETIQTEFGLVCDTEKFIVFAQSLVMFGVLVGSFLFGYLADNFGRLKPFYGAILLQYIVSYLVAFSPNIWLFLFFRFILGVLTAGPMIIAWVIILELIGKQYREVATVIFHIFFNSSLCLMPLLSYFFPNWRHFLITSTLITTFLLVQFWTTPESPRWLVTKGRTEKAAKIIERAAKWNKLPTDNIQEDVAIAVSKIKASQTAEIKHYGVMSLLQSPKMRLKILALWVNWLTVGCGFYGILQFIGQSMLSSDIFMNVFITNVIQIPGSLLCMVLLRLIGRRLTTFTSNIATALSLFIFAILPPDYDLLKFILLVIGLSGMNILFSTVYLYTGEVCPTVVRNIGVGSSSTICRIGGILAPFILGLGKYHKVLPPIGFGIMALISALAVFWLPETKNKPLPETLEDGENAT